MDFETSGLDASLLKGVADAGFTRPTPIQEQAIPAGLAGRDLLAAAMTGSGKTAAFLLPILHHLQGKPRGTTRALVLTPTRELAAQILEHLELLAKHTRIRGAAVFGGVGPGPQVEAFRRGVDVIIATPGRLLDHQREAYARLGGLEYLVIDEADRMLDMGFLPDVRRVLAQLPKNRQTLFFSATLPPEVQKLSRELLRDPVALNVERKAAPASGITQRLYPVAQDLKSQLLLELIQRGGLGHVIVFTRTKHRANRLSEWLDKRGVKNARIHGNRSQAQRTQALADFKDRRIQVLVATDIVARGIDVEQLEHVVNFDVPHLPEDYIHRVGRTARADAVGEAWTFVAPDEEGDMNAIERAVGRRIERAKLEGFDYTSRAPEQLEIPIGDRIAEIRARKREERERAAAKAARRTGAAPPPSTSRGPAPSRSSGPSRGPSSGGSGSSGSQRSSGGWGGSSGSGSSSSSGGQRSSGGWSGSSGGSGGAAPRPSSGWSGTRGDSSRGNDDDKVEVAPGIWRRR